MQENIKRNAGKANRVDSPQSNTSSESGKEAEFSFSVVPEQPLPGLSNSATMMEAKQFITEFEQSRLDLSPAVRGAMFAMSVFKDKNVAEPTQRYLVLDPVLGELAVFQSENHFKEQKTDKADFIKLSKITCCARGSRKEMTSRRINSLEVSFSTDRFILILGAYC